MELVASVRRFMRGTPSSRGSVTDVVRARLFGTDADRATAERRLAERRAREELAAALQRRREAAAALQRQQAERRAASTRLIRQRIRETGSFFPSDYTGSAFNSPSARTHARPVRDEWAGTAVRPYTDAEVAPNPEFERLGRIDDWRREWDR